MSVIGVDGELDNPKNGMTLTIGQLVDSVTKLTGERCTPAMIYNYEKHGLIPEPKRTDGGFRLFQLQDIQRVVCIKRWQAEHLTLDEIKEKMEDCQDDFAFSSDLSYLPEDRRAQILDAAEVVFPSKGYASTTLQDIANQAGISSSSIYQYFESKEELFLALTETLSFADVLDNINAALEDKAIIDFADLRHALIDVAETFMRTHIKNSEIVRLYIAESREFPDVGVYYCRFLISPMEELLNRFLQNHSHLDIFRDYDLRIAVRAFFGMLSNYFVVDEVLHGKEVIPLPMKQSIETMVDLFLNGLLNK